MPLGTCRDLSDLDLGQLSVQSGFRKAAWVLLQKLSILQYFSCFVNSCYKDRKASAAAAAKPPCKVTPAALILSVILSFTCAHRLYLVGREKPSCHTNGQSQNALQAQLGCLGGSSPWPGFVSPLQGCPCHAMPTPLPCRNYTQPRHTNAQKGPGDVQIFSMPCFNPILREYIKTRSENISFSPKLKDGLQNKPSVTGSVLHLNSRGHVYSKTSS